MEYRITPPGSVPWLIVDYDEARELCQRNPGSQLEVRSVLEIRVESAWTVKT
jgi:hypothetical protein